MRVMCVMCGIQLKDKNRYKDLMSGLNENIDHLSMASSICLYGNVLKRGDGHVLRRVLYFEFEGQRKKCRSKRT